jgi:hypothetical protein
LEPGSYTPDVGFDPYRQIRRARMTKRGDVVFVTTFLLLICAALVWAML